MITVAIVTRRLKEGKTYEDFRRAWFHTTGFGTYSKLYTMLNVNDPGEITVIGFVEMSVENALEELEIDVKERLSHSLDDVIEPEIGRKFGILISEDDFSTLGNIGYKAASIHGEETNVTESTSNLTQMAKAIEKASEKRDKARKNKDISSGFQRHAGET